MRILHLDSRREMRGGQWQALRLVQAVGSTLLCPAGSPLFERAARAGIDVRPLGFKTLCSERADLIHAHDARSHTMAVLLGKSPLVVSRRVAFPIGSRWKYARADRYIAVSQFVRGVLVEGGIPEAKIAVVPDGVPLLPVRQRADVAVTPSSGDALKGADLARQSADLAQVPILFSVDLEFDLSRASLFVYLTRSEGLGSAVLLAMSAAVPVIASRVGGLPEVIAHGENGWLTENDPLEVASAMRRLLDDEPFALRLAANARRTIQQRFSIEQMIEKTTAVYQQVLSC
jgi:glycosyltransferase involved in cell wall biosynthesis